MAKATFIRGRGTGDLLKDSDWMVAIDALLQDDTAASRQLVKKLLAKSKHGRQARMLRLLHEQHPRIAEMEKLLKVSRRSVFRYLTGLEDYGVSLTIDEDYRYHIESLPASLKRLMATGKRKRI